jgi:hypothetical protein
MDNERSFPEAKSAGALSSVFPSNKCQDQENMDVNIHFFMN